MRNTDDKIKAAFGAVHADEALKSRTKAFIARKTARKVSAYRRILPAAAAACLALVLFTGAGLYFTPTAHINIDINPSLDLGINRFDKVISVDALNKDGEALAQSLELKFTNYDEALRRIVDSRSVEVMLSEDEIMTVTVIETNTAQSANILSEVSAYAEEHGNIYCHSASSEEARAAHELGLSCGKYGAFLELQALDPAITPEEVREMTMRELRERILSLSESGEHEDSAASGGNGHHGNGNGHRYGHD